MCLWDCIFWNFNFRICVYLLLLLEFILSDLIFSNFDYASIIFPSDVLMSGFQHEMFEHVIQLVLGGADAGFADVDMIAETNKKES